jgi:hypothetical protein
MFSIIPLPGNFVSSTTGVMAGMLTDLSPYITLVLGVILVVVIIEMIVGAIRHRS